MEGGTHTIALTFAYFRQKLWHRKLYTISSYQEERSNESLVHCCLAKPWGFCCTILFSSKGCFDLVFVCLGHTCWEQCPKLLCILDLSVFCCFHNDRQAMILKRLHPYRFGCACVCECAWCVCVSVWVCDVCVMCVCVWVCVCDVCVMCVGRGEGSMCM